jgi:putative ABC transport system permease protein
MIVLALFSAWLRPGARRPWIRPPRYALSSHSACYPEPMSDWAAGVWCLWKNAVTSLPRRGRTPLVAIGILSLGVAMSVAMFTLVDAVLLRPLPFSDQESIEVIWKVDPRAGHYVEELAYPELLDLQANIPDLRYVAVLPTSLYGYARVFQPDRGEPVQIESTPVSHDFFRVLGVTPVLGRDFRASDEQVDAPPVVIVSDRVWREHLGADPHIVGRMIRLNGQGCTVIGILPRGVEFPRGAGFWVPLGIDRKVVERRGATFLMAIALRRPGAPHERVARQVDDLFRRLAREHPEAYSPTQRAEVTPLPAYWSGSSRPQLWILLGAAVLLFGVSILCAGVLILSGVVARRVEIATRIALGAGRTQIVAQFAAEGILIAAAAAVAGSALAAAAIRILIRWAPADIPRIADAGIHLPAIAFTVGTAMLAALICTVIPAWAALRVPLDSILRESGVRTSLSRSGLRIRNGFVCVQAAITAVLLAVAGLFVLSYHALSTADIGFANRDTLTLNVRVRGPGLFANSRGQLHGALYPQLLERLRQTPGVLSAAGVLVRPLEGAIGWERRFEFEFEAGRKPEEILPKANYESITPDYFRTVGTPLIEGRDFTDHDTEDTPPVAIISAGLARRIRAAGYDPVGHRLRFGASSPWLTIIGVSAAARYRDAAQEDTDIFVAASQDGPPPAYLVIRGRQSTRELAGLVRRELSALVPGQAAGRDATIGELIDANTARSRFHMILLLAFGICAVILAAGGTYGVMAEIMAARRKEAAIRTALGSPRARLLSDMVRKTLAFVLAGEAAGICAVMFWGGRLERLLYGITPHDPVLLISTAVFLFAISLWAGCRPVWISIARGRIDLNS